MNDCAQSQSLICQAYITDCYGHIEDAYNKCKSSERVILKKNVFGMLDRVKMLLDNKSVKEKNDPAQEANAAENAD